MKKKSNEAKSKATPKAAETAPETAAETPETTAGEQPSSRPASFACAQCGQVVEVHGITQVRWLEQMVKEHHPLLCGECNDKKMKQDGADNRAAWAAWTAHVAARKAWANREPSRADLAEQEQGQLVREFHAWVIAGRLKAERDLRDSRRHARELCTLAGLAEQRNSHPLVVQEFQLAAADTIRKELELEVFNGYYFAAANDICESWVDLSIPHAGRLWEWFCIEQAEAAAKADSEYEADAGQAAGEQAAAGKPDATG